MTELSQSMLRLRSELLLNVPRAELEFGACRPFGALTYNTSSVRVECTESTFAKAQKYSAVRRQADGVPVWRVRVRTAGCVRCGVCSRKRCVTVVWTKPSSGGRTDGLDIARLGDCPDHTQLGLFGSHRCSQRRQRTLASVRRRMLHVASRSRVFSLASQSAAACNSTDLSFDQAHLHCRQTYMHTPASVRFGRGSDGYVRLAGEGSSGIHRVASQKRMWG